MKPDVIAAIATAPGRSAIGVVRLSGTALDRYVEALLGGALKPRVASHRNFIDAAGEIIDSGIAILFPAPHSFTGEDVLELHGHGGVTVLQLVLRRCLELGARIARPGEFTERAFLNGKVDLAQAESIADLIEAGSEAAARAAIRSLRGEFSRRIESIAAGLMTLRVHVEAHLDFPEEGIAPNELGEIAHVLRGLCRQLADLEKTARTGKLLRDGLVAVLAGPPNVGKSSLLNRLAEEDVAIVTDVAGTTRDLIRSDIVIRGVPVHIVDTAGLRSSEDAVEKLGIDRAFNAIKSADIVLAVEEADEPSNEKAPVLPGAARTILVANKIDLIGLEPSMKDIDGTLIVCVSAKTGEGIELLKDAILSSAGWAPETNGTFLARERHLHAIRTALDHLDHAKTVQNELELMAEDLRNAHTALGGVTGRITTEDLLGEIFSRFCVGK